MNAKNINKCVLLIIILLFLSCKEKQEVNNTREENTYQIIGQLLGQLRESMVSTPGFPPPPGGGTYEFTIKDSLWSYKYFHKQTLRKKTIAFLPQIYVSEKKQKQKELKIIKECTDDRYLINSFLKSENNIKIDINKIANFKKDSLFYYTDKHKKMLGKGFQEIDMLLSFYDITFNKDYTKAMIIAGITYERLSGFSTLIYLEKKHYHWVVKCEKVLSIS